jgi:hypothetical protein
MAFGKDLSREFIEDRDIAYIERRIYIPAAHFSWLPALVGTGGAVTADVEFDPSAGPNSRGRLETADTAANYEVPGASLGVQLPLYAEVNATGIGGFLMNTAGDEVNYLGAIPSDLDITKQVRLRVWWTTDSTTNTDTVDWVVRYSLLQADQSTAIGSPATVLNTVIAQDLVLGSTAELPHATAFGVIDRSVIPENSVLWGLEVEVDAKDAGLAEDLWFLGLEVRYTPRLTVGSHNLRAARRLSTAFGSTLAGTQED